MTLPDDVATPFLLVDRAGLERNLAEAVDLAGPLALRPHFKAHKCTRLLAVQVAAGNTSGVTCATAAEARVLAEAGFAGVLVANEIADPVALADLAAAAARTDVTACVDSDAHVDALASLGAPLGVLVDVDVGQRRCGLEPGSPDIPRLAARVAAAPGLELRGLMGYDGHAQHLGPEDRDAAAATTAGVLAAERDRLLAAGLPVDVVSGGGTGTLTGSVAAGVLTEIQAGSYALMDVEYGSAGAPFERAVHCVATIVSRHGARAVADAGLKALSCEHGLPEAVDPALAVVAVADEHTTLALDSGHPLAVGDRVALVPHHLDPTVNLHPALWVSDGDSDLERWVVDGRRVA